MEIRDNQRFQLRIGAIKSSKGNDAPIDGNPEWFVDNPNVLALTPSEDGRSCLVQAVGPVGTGKVSCKVDADMGEGIENLIAVFDVNVVPGKAAVFTLEAGPAEDVPAE